MFLKEKRKAIIVDLDGTLCNIEHRLPFITEETPKNWAEFNNPERIRADVPNQWCVSLVNAFRVQGYEILFVSGRMANPGVLEATFDWINWTIYNGLSNNIVLLMRKDGDHRVDHEVKLEIYLNHIQSFYDVAFCVDDRKQVVDMWRSQGLTCLQCAEGNF